MVQKNITNSDIKVLKKIHIFYSQVAFENEASLITQNVGDVDLTAASQNFKLRSKLLRLDIELRKNQISEAKSRTVYYQVRQKF